MDKSRQIVDKVDELGLQPFEAPDPLPPIEENEVKLICWMVIAPPIEEDSDSVSSLSSQVTLNT